eukprot:3965519-Prymnesium_polylepis.3
MMLKAWVTPVAHPASLTRCMTPLVNTRYHSNNLPARSAGDQYICRQPRSSCDMYAGKPAYYGDLFR